MTAVSTLNPVPAWAAGSGLVDLRKPSASLGVKEVGDRQLIVETINRYGWAYDERREDVLADCFTDDAVFDGSVAGGFAVGPYEGRAAVVGWLKGIWGTQTDQRRHCVLNVLIDDLTDHSASVLAYALITGAENGVARLVTTGFYRIRMAKQDGIWRIARLFGGFDSAF